MPDREDGIALAIAHGSRMGHAHSDWLVDCARDITGGDVDWALLEQILQRRRIVFPALIALGALATRFGLPVPDGFLDRLRACPMAWTARWTELLLARSRSELGVPARLLRRLLKRRMLRRVNSGHGSGAAPGTLHGRIVRHRGQAPPDGLSMTHDLPLPGGLAVIDSPKCGLPRPVEILPYDDMYLAMRINAGAATRFRHGQGKDRRTRMLDRIESTLSALTDAATGQPVVGNIQRPSRSYPGARAHRLPDLLVTHLVERSPHAILSPEFGRIAARPLPVRPGNHASTARGFAVDSAVDTPALRGFEDFALLAKRTLAAN